MKYVVRVTVPGVAEALFSKPMHRAAVDAAERALKRRHGFGVTVRPAPPRPLRPRRESEEDVDAWAQTVAARRAS